LQNKAANYNLENNTITVTNLNDWREIDLLWQASDHIQTGQICTLDMFNINSLNPQAIVMLFILSQKIKMQSGSNILLDKLAPQINGYLRRIIFFDYELATSKGQFTRIDQSRLFNAINKLGSWFYDNFKQWFPDN